jgi:hypothetical protein
VVTITIVSLANASVRSAPGGIGYLAEVYQAADLTDELSVRQSPDRWLQASLARLKRRYGGLLRIRWVHPYSLAGLYLAIRYRIRTYPTIIVGSQLLGPITDPAEFENLIAARLAAS